jgi:peptide/nickel transport system permease protein
VNRAFFLYVSRRVALFVPQILAVVLVAFLLVRFLPGDPAEAILGPHRTEAGLENLTRLMGLDKPLHEQYVIYVGQVIQGDLGRSWFTGQGVATDLLARAPATLELVMAAMLIAIFVGVSLGALTAVRHGRGRVVGGLSWYMRLAGAFPDFWIALVAVYVFFYRLRWAPPPLGRLGFADSPPDRLTGLYTIDSILTGNLDALVAATSRLALPALVLGLIVAPMLAKVTSATLSEVMEADYVRYGRAMGLGRGVLFRYALRNALPPVLTIVGILFVFLLGGAVLIEKVFSWGGIGQYAVQAIGNADFAAIQGFVLVAALFTLVVYLVVDLLHMAIDPRVTHY